jgi:hypothetical protein
VPELIELAGRAEPVRVGPVIDVDTTVPIDAGALRRWVNEALALEHRAEKWMPIFGKNDAKTKS